MSKYKLMLGDEELAEIESAELNGSHTKKSDKWDEKLLNKTCWKGKGEIVDVIQQDGIEYKFIFSDGKPTLSHVVSPLYFAYILGLNGVKLSNYAISKMEQISSAI